MRDLHKKCDRILRGRDEGSRSRQRKIKRKENSSVGSDKYVYSF